MKRQRSTYSPPILVLLHFARSLPSQKVASILTKRKVLRTIKLEIFKNYFLFNW